jgi:hypothetical protein
LSDAGCFDQNSLYSFDLFSGATPLIGAFRATAGSGVAGLAALSTVPEPAILGLLGLGLAGLALRTRKKP